LSIPCLTTKIKTEGSTEMNTPLAEAVLNTPVGSLRITAKGARVVGVEFCRAKPIPPATDLLKKTAREIGEYFAGTRKTFTVPIEYPEGATEFQRRAWDAMSKIPYGETRTYGQLAATLGTSPRALGGACRRNSLVLLVPCHRIVARSGLGGYSGDWEKGKALSVKEKLLELEGGR
jgi:methylated-DNA-[protein]-cysteine S-methyltransferase